MPALRPRAQRGSDKGHQAGEALEGGGMSSQEVPLEGGFQGKAREWFGDGR